MKWFKGYASAADHLHTSAYYLSQVAVLAVLFKDDFKVVLAFAVNATAGWRVGNVLTSRLRSSAPADFKAC